MTVDPNRWLVGRGLGSAPDLLVEELLYLIGQAASTSPRSLQRKLGPSEIGSACSRKLGYRLLGTDRGIIREREVPWLATIGTAVHAWLAGIFSTGTLAERFLVEQKICAGIIHGETLEGSCDLYDRITCTVVDWKITGPTTLRTVRSKGASEAYRVQVQTYGYGFTARGYPVDRVLVIFLPRNGPLTDARHWGAPYDPATAQAAIDRVNGIAVACDVLGDDALAILPTAEEFCHTCPYFRPRSTDLSTGCPGHPKPIPVSTGSPFGPVPGEDQQ